MTIQLRLSLINVTLWDLTICALGLVQMIGLPDSWLPAVLPLNVFYEF